MLAIMFISKRTIQVEWGDCDPQGIVFNPRFFVFFDACTAGLFSAADIDLFSMQKSGKIAGIPMADTRSRFIMPILFGDRGIDVRSAVFGIESQTLDVIGVEDSQA